MKLKFIATLACFVFLLSGCSYNAKSDDPIYDQDPIAVEYNSIEEKLVPHPIETYEGFDLGNKGDFRENSIDGVQEVNIDDYTLSITGLVDNPMELTYEEVLGYQSYTTFATLNCIEGWDSDILWEGILLEDLLADAQPQSDANTVIFHAVDGYTTSLKLSEILDRDIILAYKMNGDILPAELGYPFIVVAEDSYGYKWARWVDEIELSNDPSYTGYWESRGYDNDANITGE